MDDRSVDPLSHSSILKIVEFQVSFELFGAIYMYISDSNITCTFMLYIAMYILI